MNEYIHIYGMSWCVGVIYMYFRANFWASSLKNNGLIAIFCDIWIGLVIIGFV